MKVETKEGKSVDRTVPPSLWSYFLVIVFPVLGFVLPWGAVKTLIWVGIGFLSQGRQEQAKAD